MNIEYLLDIDELSALPYFVPDFRKNPGLETVLSEMEPVLSKPAFIGTPPCECMEDAVEESCFYCAPPTGECPSIYGNVVRNERL